LLFGGRERYTRRLSQVSTHFQGSEIVAQAQAKKTNPLKKWPRKAKGGEGKACSVANCKRPYRAKSYCFFHYKKWRQGELPHSRYRTCSKAECRKPVVKGGLCETHLAEVAKKSAGDAAEAAPAA
jgi:hypothetical protein